MTPDEQLAAISSRAHRMVDERSAGVREVFARLAEHGLRVWNREEWSDEHRRFAEAYFAREIEPILTPLAIQQLKPTPLLPNLQLHVAALLVGSGPLEVDSPIFAAMKSRRTWRRYPGKGDIPFSPNENWDSPPTAALSWCRCRANCRAG